MDKNDKRLYDILQFTFILLVAMVLLYFLLQIRPDMAPEQRIVASHTSIVLTAMGADNVLYEYVVRVPDVNVNQKEVVKKIQLFGFMNKSYPGGIELRAKHLDPPMSQVVDIYIQEVMRQGLPIFVSPATIELTGKQFEVDIIPECVGWMGIFAITALILAYPRVPWKKRAMGLLTIWPIMYVINVLRLSTSIYSAYSVDIAAFEWTHTVLWRTVLVGFALIFWLMWIYFFVEERTITEGYLYLKARVLRKKLKKKSSKK
jgi:exosortase/archaeosortase family protein